MFDNRAITERFRPGITVSNRQRDRKEKKKINAFPMCKKKILVPYVTTLSGVSQLAFISETEIIVLQSGAFQEFLIQPTISMIHELIIYCVMNNKIY